MSSTKSIDECGDAFPPSVDLSDGIHRGMTYRQWLIGMALKGELSRGSESDAWPDAGAPGCARRCILFADAVIAELRSEDANTEEARVAEQRAIESEVFGDEAKHRG